MVVDLTADDGDHQENQMHLIMQNKPDSRATIIPVGPFGGKPITAEEWFPVEDPISLGNFNYFYSNDLAEQWARDYVSGFNQCQPVYS